MDMKTISGIEFASEHNGTDVFRLIELAYEQGQKDGHSEQLGTNLAEVGTDLISRAAAQTELQLSARRYTVAHEAHGEGRIVWSEDLISVSDAMDVLRKIPSAQPMRGKWICTGSPDESWGMMYECSICGNRDYGGNYCSYCGAKMEDSEDETD